MKCANFSQFKKHAHLSRHRHIVKQPDVDALVNSANANLRFGSGVAGAIHSAAGPELEQYCRRHSPFADCAGCGGCVTCGFELPNAYVICTRATTTEKKEQSVVLQLGQAGREKSAEL